MQNSVYLRAATQMQVCAEQTGDPAAKRDVLAYVASFLEEEGHTLAALAVAQTLHVHLSPPGVEPAGVASLAGSGERA